MKFCPVYSDKSGEHVCNYPPTTDREAVERFCAQANADPWVHREWATFYVKEIAE